MARKTTAPKRVRRVRRSDEKKTRRDSWVSALSGIGTQKDPRQYAVFQAAKTNWRENIDLWRQDDLAGRIVEMLPNDMLREPWELCIEGDDDNKISKQVMTLLEDMDLNDRLWRALCLERAVGGAGVVMGTNDLAEMNEPIDLDNVTSLKWLETFEPLELMATRWQNDPELPGFGRPDIYTFLPVSPGGAKRSGIQIHASRILLFPGIVVSRRQITSQSGWGDAILTRCRETLRDFQTSWAAAGLLLHSFATPVWKIKGLAEIISLDKDEELKTRIEMMQLAMSTVRATVIDQDEDFTRQQTPVNGLAEMMVQFATRLAAAAETPVTRLMGMSPSGMNATGESDIRNWYDVVGSHQERKLKPPIERVVKVAFRALNIEEPENWYIHFPPLWQPTEAEQATTRKTQMETDTGYITAGVYSKEEVRAQGFGGRQWTGARRVTGPPPTPPPAPPPSFPPERSQRQLPAPKADDAETDDSEERADEDSPGRIVVFQGIPIVIESPRGSTREWTSASGDSGSTVMRYDYGYILGPAGADGDSLDAYVGPSSDAPVAYVVHQLHPDDGTYDEDKVMLGFDSANHAKDAYLSQYDDPKFFGGMETMPIDQLRRVVASLPQLPHLWTDTEDGLSEEDAENSYLAWLGQRRDDDWDEDSHPRAPDGKFGEGGGGGEKKNVPVSEKHASQMKEAREHAKTAVDHAKSIRELAKKDPTNAFLQNKLKAAETTAKAARSAARKAEKSTSESEAAKHVATASAKAQEAQSHAGEATAHVEKIKSFAQGGAPPTPSENTLKAFEKKESAKPLGGVMDVMASMMGMAKADPNSEIAKQAMALSQAANNKSEVAKPYNSGQVGLEAHQAAMEAHKAAAQAEKSAGYHGTAETHSAKANAHQTMINHIQQKLQPKPTPAPLEVLSAGQRVDEAHVQPYGQFQQERSSFAPSLPGKEKAAALRYSGGAYREINDALRDGKSHEITGRLDKVIDRATLPRDIIVSRGVNDDFAKQMATLQVGDTFHDKAYVSTTNGTTPAFPGTTEFLIHVPKGMKAAPIPSQHPHENEYLLPRNSRFEVTHVERVPGLYSSTTKVVVHARVVAQGVDA